MTKLAERCPGRASNHLAVKGTMRTPQQNGTGSQDMLNMYTGIFLIHHNIVTCMYVCVYIYPSPCGITVDAIFSMGHYVACLLSCFACFACNANGKTLLPSAVPAMPLAILMVGWWLYRYMSKDLKGSCRNLYMRGHMMENVAQTMESDMRCSQKA